MDESLINAIGHYEQYLEQHGKVCNKLEKEGLRGCYRLYVKLTCNHQCFLKLSRAKHRHSAHNLSSISYPAIFNAIRYAADSTGGYEIVAVQENKPEQKNTDGADSIPLLKDPMFWFSALPPHELRQTRQEFIAGKTPRGHVLPNSFFIVQCCTNLLKVPLLRVVHARHRLVLRSLMATPQLLVDNVPTGG